jgi:hypothetical protein
MRVRTVCRWAQLVGRRGFDARLLRTARWLVGRIGTDVREA